MSAAGVKFGLQMRSFPPASDCVDSLVAAEAEGFDIANLSDQLQGAYPRALRPDADPDRPAKRSVSDAWLDPFALIAAAAGRTRRLTLSLAVTDAVRRPPAVLAQTMATLDWLAQGRCTFALGAGEEKQFGPYGLDRTATPTARLEEALQVIRALYGSEGQPVSRPSRWWPLRDAVFDLPLHGGRAPRLLVAGTGPRTERLAGQLADGLLLHLPGGVLGSPERWADKVGRVRQIAADARRDPDALEFWGMVSVVLADSEAEAAEYLDHPFVRWTAIGSTPTGAGWRQLGPGRPLGVAHPWGDAWEWSRDFSVTRYTRSELEAAISAVPSEVCRQITLWGSPKDVAGQLDEYIAGGLTHIVFFSLAPLIDRSAAPGEPERLAEVMRIIRPEGRSR